MYLFLSILFISFLLITRISSEYICSCGCCAPDPNGSGGCVTITPFYQHLDSPHCTGDYFSDCSICKKLCQSAYTGDCEPSEVVGTCSDPDQNFENNFNSEKFHLLDSTNSIDKSEEFSPYSLVSNSLNSVFPDFSCICSCYDAAFTFVGFAPILINQPDNCDSNCINLWTNTPSDVCTVNYPNAPKIQSFGETSDYHVYQRNLNNQTLNELFAPAGTVATISSIGPVYLSLISSVPQRVLYGYITFDLRFPSFQGECVQVKKLPSRRYLYNCPELNITTELNNVVYHFNYSMPDRNGDASGNIDFRINITNSD